jgi:3-deoxy-D-manno-octulosonic-acid transferase
VSYRVYRTASNVLWLTAGWVLGLRAAADAAWRERLGGLPAAGPGPIWLHAASVGEVSAALPLVRALRDEGERILLTVVTPTGRAVARGSVPDGVPVSHPPLDFVRPVRAGLARVRPRALLLVETELWPTLIFEAAAAGATVGIVNGRLSRGSARRYRVAGSPLGGVLGSVSFVAAQSDRDRARFVAAGLAEESVRVVGNTKFDAVAGPPSEGARRETRRALGLPAASPVVVYGCVRPREEGAVAHTVGAIAGDVPGVRQIVAPRHLDRVEPLMRCLEDAGVGPVRRSASEDASPSVIVLDTTGELSSVYAIASVAFVGGTLAPYGGHNPLEPAAQGVPVVLGPHTESCLETAAAIVDGGGAVVVRSREELAGAVVSFLRDGVARATAAANALRVVEEGRGATERTVRLLAREGILRERSG